MARQAYLYISQYDIFCWTAGSDNDMVRLCWPTEWRAWNPNLVAGGRATDGWASRPYLLGTARIRRLAGRVPYNSGRKDGGKPFGLRALQSESNGGRDAHPTIGATAARPYQSETNGGARRKAIRLRQSFGGLAAVRSSRIKCAIQPNEPTVFWTLFLWKLL